MKVIDLLNKMANGEEVPKKIKFENNIYEYNKERQDYIHKINDFRSETLLFNVMSTYYIEELLEANVELIEDEVDIDNIEESEAFYKEIENLNDAKLEIDNLRISHNELVQAVKQLNKEIKSIKEK